jgi:DnaJ-domain-containing protein 1
MDRFFDRLGDLLRALMGADSGALRHFDAQDPDVRAALAELDEYLDSGIHARRWDFSQREEQAAGAGEGQGRDGGRETAGGGPGGGENQRGRQQGRERQARQPAPPEALRRDYANLEVPFAAPLQQVRDSYRRLIGKYHPDRFAADPEKLRLATEISMRLNESFQSIERYERGRGAR